MVALMAVVIFGAVALGVDLGHQTATRRSLQNISDAASLAAARDVCASPPCTVSGPGSLALAQQQAANDAAASLALNQGWPPLWIALNPANTCAASGYCFAATYAGETVAFSTPPATPAANCSVVTACAEVDLASTVNNGFATIIGQPHSVIRSTSIGFHANVNTKFGYALFSNTDVNTGNSPELINGNVYIGSNFSPQSNGQSYLCALFQSANEPGMVVFGAPQSSPPAVNYGTCSTGKGDISSAVPVPPPPSCPNGGSWQAPPAGGANGICLASPALQPPNFSPPTITGPLPGGNCNITSQPQLSGGVYDVTAATCPGGLSITFSSSFTALSCTSFKLSSDATVSISIKKQSIPAAGVTMSAYGGPGCGGQTPAVIDGDQAAFYQAASPAPPTQPVISVDGDGCCPPLTITGSIVLPAGAVSLSNNSALTVTGQAVVSDWTDQSGNHPNAVINYDASDADNVPEQLRLVQ